ncbi:hypothetical protein LSTR_LSTR013082 [Laodelphax striatellus]|uniref:Uncharacterized protein n=1 Tax=Laodelphax striatellus TaxID=195883 RepID=A0A482XL62_LAOST|nr:hypothetical protein LSTR_LSTR013082 [Laodelphax striatellus]
MAPNVGHCESQLVVTGVESGQQLAPGTCGPQMAPNMGHKSELVVTSAENGHLVHGRSGLKLALDGDSGLGTSGQLHAELLIAPGKQLSNSSSRSLLAFGLQLAAAEDASGLELDYIDVMRHAHTESVTTPHVNGDVLHRFLEDSNALSDDEVCDTEMESVLGDCELTRS